MNALFGTGHWALASQQPFCIDTLRFDQWLQFVFIGRLRQLLADQLPLPDQCAVAPMAAQCFSARDQGPLIAQLARIDALHSGQGGQDR